MLYVHIEGCGVSFDRYGQGAGWEEEVGRGGGGEGGARGRGGSREGRGGVANVTDRKRF